MFVLNIKLNFKKILLILIILSVLTAGILELINFNNNNNALETANNTVNYNYVLTNENYIDMLKQIHDNIDENINKTIKLHGFVFKKSDLKENIFVCGMNTIINEEENVAGILCQSNDYNSLKDNEWIEITGIITKGEYNGVMPIIKVFSIKKIETPKNTYIG